MTYSIRPGRPREFELEDAARNALNVFWEKGYEGTSLPDLIAGTNLSRGSLYKAFGDKKGLLLAALDIYIADGLQATKTLLLQAETPVKAIRASLERYAMLSAGEAGKRGCLVVSLAAEMAAYDDDVAQRVGHMFRHLQYLYAEAIFKGQQSGEVREVDKHVLARFLVCQIEGMRVLGKTGASESEMFEQVECILRLIEK